jgi:hypothetical protein
MAKDLDMAKVATVEGAFTCLHAIVEQFQADASNLDSCGMVGKPWSIIAAELERTIERAEKKVRACGYPLAPRRELFAGQFSTTKGT